MSIVGFILKAFLQGKTKVWLKMISSFDVGFLKKKMGENENFLKANSKGF